MRSVAFTGERNMISNRFRRGLLSMAAIAVCLSIGIPSSHAQEMKKVKIALGTAVMNLTYPWLTLPISLGYWKEEGYDVKILPAGASLHVASTTPMGPVRGPNRLIRPTGKYCRA